MKNSVAMAFLVIAFIAGAMICAGLYFGVVFAALGALGLGGMAVEGLASVVLVVGVCIGAALALDFGWSRFNRDDGSPEWAARIVGLLLGAPLVLLALAFHAGPGLDQVAIYKVPGFFAVAGFIAAAGWIHKALAPKG